LFGNAKAASYVLVAAAGFLLLIACANVSNLLLARLMLRDKELAIRTVLGGSRTRLILQLLTESTLLGVLACAAGIVLACWLRRPLLALSPYRVSGLEHLPFDGRVLGFSVGLGLLTTFLFGLMPAFRATGIRLAEAIKVGETAVVGGRGSLRVLSMVAALEISTILILATGAGLMLQSFWKIRYSNLGFQPDRLIAATLKLAGPRYLEKTQRLAFIKQLLERAQNLPGVESAAVTSAGEIPPGTWHATNSFAIEGRVQPLGGPRPIARYPTVSAGYFGIMGIPLLRGRLLENSDGDYAPPVVVVSQMLAHRYFNGENPIGRRVRTGGDGQPWCAIAGVVGDIKTSGLTAAPEPTIYFPYRQTDGLTEIGLVMRSPLDAGIIASELRTAVTGLDPNQPISSIQAMGDRLSESVSKPRFTTALLCAFAGLAVVLGMIGVYGVMGCRVRWQLREVAVRQALGAQRRDVVWHVLRQGFAIILPGLCLGLPGSVALSRLLSSMLYEVPANDPLTLAAVSAGLVGVALLACWIPAMRAARVDPLESLRHD
jgi:putative ABC transport system permease protein